MKKTFLSLLFVGIMLNAFCQKKESRVVSEFTGINASNSFDITVTKGSVESLTIEADDDIMPHVRSEVKNGILRLYLDGKKIGKVKTLKAFIVVKTLDNVSLSGACKLSSSDIFTPDNFKSDCSGASHLDLTLKTGNMFVNVSGAGRIKLDAEATGDAMFDMSGASKISGNLEAGKAYFDTAGASKIELTGSASEMYLDTSGASNLNMENFEVKSIFVKSSGAGKIDLFATEALRINASGSSSVNYKGSPSIDMTGSGASRVRKISKE